MILVPGSVWVCKSQSGVLGARPHLVVNSSNSGIVSVVPFTTTNPKGRMKLFRVRVEPSVDLNLKEVSWLKCEFITTVSVKELNKYLGTVDKTILAKARKSVSRLFV